MFANWFLINKIMVCWNSWSVCIYNPVLKTFIKQCWQVVQYLLKGTQNGSIFSLTHQLVYLIQFVTCNRTQSSWLGYKPGCIDWNFFHFKGFGLTFSAVNSSFPFWTKGCLFPWGSNSRSGSGVNSSGHCIYISKWIGN